MEVLGLSTGLCLHTVRRSTESPAPFSGPSYGNQAHTPSIQDPVQEIPMVYVIRLSLFIHCGISQSHHQLSHSGYGVNPHSATPRFWGLVGAGHLIFTTQHILLSCRTWASEHVASTVLLIYVFFRGHIINVRNVIALCFLFPAFSASFSLL